MKKKKRGRKDAQWIVVLITGSVYVPLTSRTHDGSFVFELC